MSASNLRIDAHQHFWKIARGDYGWLTPELEGLYRDYLPVDLTPHIERAGISGTVLVQAAPTLAETEFMLSLAARHNFIKGVVGWIDFDDPAALTQIENLSENPALVGLRPMIQDIAEDDWMLGAHLTPLFQAMIDADLTFDALTLPRHLKNLSLLLARHPDLRVVIDHGSKPEIRKGKIDDWATDMARLARETSAYCKLSGLVTEASPTWSTHDLRPYAEHLFKVFGPERLIWGSDWPVCTLAATYAEWVTATDDLLVGFDHDQKAGILGGNAVRAYKLQKLDEAAN